jgi:cobalt-zinc-cadmium efflux system outer membrane protein
VTLGLTDLLLLPARRQMAATDLVRVQQRVADAFLQLRLEVERAWVGYVAARQLAGMRALVATSAEQSATLAQRFRDAGNINALQLAQARVEAAEARSEADHAEMDAARARLQLAAVMGVAVDGTWQTPSGLPAVPDAASDAEVDVASLLPRATTQRPDVLAAQAAVRLRADALDLVRRWRWLGEVAVGYEREGEPEGGALRGPTLAFALPVFDQGQPAIARARAELLAAQAHADERALAARNEVLTAAAELRLARSIAQRYQKDLLPARAAVVARTQEEVNFMLAGVFELMHARRAEFVAQQRYVEGVRDYWLARAALRAAVGGPLADRENEHESDAEDGR